jgi:hypothetical protein
MSRPRMKGPSVVNPKFVENNLRSFDYVCRKMRGKLRSG